jgi:hypothetical protein
MKPIYYGLFASAVLTAQGQVFFSFDYSLDTNGFFSGENSYRQNTLNAAAQRLGSFLTNQSLSAVPGGPEGNALYIVNPSSDGNSTTQLDNVSVAANEIRVYVGSYAIGSGALALAGPGNGFSYEVDTEPFTNRGTGFNPPIVGSMIFNSSLFTGSVYWDQDVSNYEDPNPEAFDFDAYTFIQHELLHVLGYGTNARWLSMVEGNFFTGAHSVADFGGLVPVSGDDAHWQGTVVSTNLYGQSQVTMMSPFIFNDERKEMTSLDVAGLKDLGWNATFQVIPEPSAFATIAGAGVLAFVATRRRRKV